MHESRWWEIIDKQQSDIYYNFNNLAECIGIEISILITDNKE